MHETALFSAVLIATSAALLLMHLRAWRQRDHGGLTDDDYHFFRGQFQRRLVTSSLIGVIGLTMLASVWVPDLRFATFIWLSVLALVGGVLIMALIDWGASRRFVARHLQDHAKLRDQLLLEARQYRDQQRRGEE